MFTLFFSEESKSIVEDIQQKFYVALYLVLPFITVLVNFTVQLYLEMMRKQHRNAALNARTIFTIESVETDLNEEKFSFSISHVMIIPFFYFDSFCSIFC